MAQRTLLSLTFALLVAMAFTVSDYLVLNDIIPNRGPRLSAYDFLKTGVAVCLAVAMVASIYVDGRELRRIEPPTVARPGPVILSYVLATTFVLLFVVSPSAFNWLGSEDSLVEYLSALFCFAGSVLFVGAFLAARRSPGPSPQQRVALWAAPLGAVVLFLIGMEEISWGQRIIGFGTPESFAANRQGEVNLHNFATTPITSVYRIGSWALLILLPFLAAFGPGLSLLERFRDVLPPPWIGAMSVPVASFTFNAWPFMPTQVAAFSSLLILAIFTVHAHRAGQKESARLFGAGVVLMVVAQAIFLLGGDRFVRHWDVSEYQELFMPIGLAAIAWVTRERIQARNKQLQPHRVGEGLQF